MSADRSPQRFVSLINNIDSRTNKFFVYDYERLLLPLKFSAFTILTHVLEHTTLGARLNVLEEPRSLHGRHSLIPPMMSSPLQPPTARSSRGLQPDCSLRFALDASIDGPCLVDVSDIDSICIVDARRQARIRRLPAGKQSEA
jgi:hypothetical protein